ncbi:hypothetical protein BH10PLA2_BH10PLA2_17780 [soil metagenome]
MDAMNSAKIRFVLLFGVFLAWLGYLLNLAVTTAKPIVLFEPQFLVSSLDVIGNIPSVKDGATEIIVREVHWPTTEGARLKDQKLKVTNLSDCKDDWRDADALYILPLMPDGKDTYRIAPLPRSPGFVGAGTRAGRPRIYPVTPETRQRLDQIQKPKAPKL